MPSFPPRIEPTKKENQLSHKKRALRLAILKNLPADKVRIAAEKYRLAKLSKNKAILHSIREKEWQKKVHYYNAQQIEEEMLVWHNKPIEEIISEIKAEMETVGFK